MTLPTAFLDRPIAHRALHGPTAPENSRAAIEAAIAAGYGIEIDVQFSRDGVPVVFHDYALNRLTSTSGALAQHSAAELTALTLMGTEETIPTLAEVLDLVAGRVPLLVELKDQDGALGPNTGALEQATCALTAAYDGPLALMSFNPHSVAALTGPHAKGLTTCAFDSTHWPHIPESRRAELRARPETVDFISHRHSDLPRVADWGLPTLCWTIRSPDEARAAREIAQNITFEGYAA